MLSFEHPYPLTTLFQVAGIVLPSHAYFRGQTILNRKAISRSKCHTIPMKLQLIKKLLRQKHLNLAMKILKLGKLKCYLFIFVVSVRTLQPTLNPGSSISRPWIMYAYKIDLLVQEGKKLKLLMKVQIHKTLKWHILVPTRVVWFNMCEDPIFRSATTWTEEPRRKSQKRCFTYVWKHPHKS